MSKFLDPKADLTFKKVFGEHKNLVMSLLNALLPLEKGREVESIEYLQPELPPRTPLSKCSRGTDPRRCAHCGRNGQGR